MCGACGNWNRGVVESEIACDLCRGGCVRGLPLLLWFVMVRELVV